MGMRFHAEEGLVKHLNCRKNINNSELIRRTASRLMLLGLGFVVILGFAANASAQASDVYITPDGGGSGVCTSNTHPPSWFNNSANWGSSGTQIGAGTTVHLCGTFTGGTNATMFTAHGSGTSGNPITILFESGANLTSPAWSGTTGAINISGHSYLVVDGGTNGIIQNTDNGTNLGLHQSTSKAIYAGDSNSPSCHPGCRVTNLTVANLYVHVAGSDCSINQSGINAISFWPGATGFRVDHNTFHDMGWAINGWGDNIEVDHNNVYNIDHGTANGAGANTNGMSFHDNHIHDFTNWDTQQNCYHHDGIHIWNSDPNTNSNVMVYNNLFDGDSGINITSFLYTENRVSGITIFNNVFVLKSNRGMTGMIWMGNYFDDSPKILNNTFIAPGGKTGTIHLEHNTNVTWENNLLSGGNTFLSFVQGTTLKQGDFNSYEAKSPNGGNYSYNLEPLSVDSLSSWKASTQRDAHSSEHATVSVSLDGTLQSGSPAINAGTNLTSLGIPALNADKNGEGRPASGNWTIGAYNFGASSSTVAPPSGLKAVVQ
jgi:hypothetical protein